MEHCKTILVVEDEMAIRETLRDVLEMQGYDVITAANGQEALEKLESVSTSPCMILLDLMMPEMNGWQFLDQQRVHPLLSQIPVVICSAYKESAMSIRPVAVIEKPVQLPSLLKTVRTVCA